MEAAVQRCRASSLPPPSLPPKTLDPDKDTRLGIGRPRTVAAPTSSQGEDDAKGSEGWRLQSDPSATSSRITTPELSFIGPRTPQNTRDMIKPYHSESPHPIFLLPTLTTGAHDLLDPTNETLASPRNIAASGNPGPSQQDHSSLQPDESSEQRDSSFLLSGGELGKLDADEASPVTPQSGLAANGSAFPGLLLSEPNQAPSVSVHAYHFPTGPRNPLPPPAFLRRDDSASDYAMPRRLSMGLISRNEELPDSGPIKPDHNTHINLPRHHPPFSYHHRRGSSQNEHYASSASDASSETPSDFVSSEEDPIDYRNARYFPPQLPVSVSRLSQPKDKASALSNIASWVSMHEHGPLEKTSDSRRHVPEPSLGIDAGMAESFATTSENEIEELWQELKRKRAHLADTKVQMERKRKELRQLRRRRDEADNAFMNSVRPLLVNVINQREVLHAPISFLERRWTDMQRLRDEYHLLESNYEELEDVLDDEDHALNTLETRFFSLLAAGQDRAPKRRPSVDDNNQQPTIPSDVPFILRGISPDGPSEALHPLYVDFTSAVGDLDNAKEEYQDLCWLKDQYDEEMKLKQRTGQKIPDRMQEFLEEYPSEEKRMKESMDALRNKAERLRRLCEGKNVMRKHMSARMVYELDPTVKFEDMELEDRETILGRTTTLAHPRFPELLSQPDHVLAAPLPLTTLGALRQATKLPDSDPEKRLKKRLASKEYAIDKLLQDTPGNTGKAGFVNRWLLQELRQCPLKVLLLHTIFISSRLLRIRDPWRWQCDVLHYWWHDDTTEYKEEMQTTASSTQYSSRLGTPQMSRAASDGHLTYGREHQRQTSSSDVGTVLT